MRKMFFLLFILTGCTITFAQLQGTAEHDGLQLRANIMGDGHVLPAEPLVIAVKIKNVGKQTLWLPYYWEHLAQNHSGPYLYWRFQSGPGINSTGKVYYSRYSYINAPKIGEERRSFSLNPGDEKTAQMIATHGICSHSESGEYKGEVVLALRPWDKGGWHGHVSVSLGFTTVKPEGADQAAYGRMMAYLEGVEPKEGRCLGTLEDVARAINILEYFPTSTYAGWVVAPSLGKFDKADPKQIFTLIKNKKYNPWNSVPYPGTKDGWKGLGGAELAKWQNEWILKILKDHPDFAWHDRLQLTLAVNYYYLGRDKEAESILKSLGTGRRSSSGGWAERFLNLVKAEKMRKHTLDSLPTVEK